MSSWLNKVSHQGLLYNLKSICIFWGLNDLFENYLSGRFQRFLLNEQTLSWKPGRPSSRLRNLLSYTLFGSLISIPSRLVFCRNFSNTPAYIRTPQNIQIVNQIYKLSGLKFDVLPEDSAQKLENPRLIPVGKSRVK